LHYWYKASLFASVMATCGKGGACYVKNDSPYAFTGKLEIVSTDFSTGETMLAKSMDLELAAGAGSISWFTIGAEYLDGTKSALVATVTAKDGTRISRNVIALATPEKMLLKKANIKATIASDTANADGSVDIDVTADAVAMFVTLTTLADGRFSDNAFLVDGSGKATVQFIPFSPVDMGKLRSSLRAEDVSAYQDQQGGVK